MAEDWRLISPTSVLEGAQAWLISIQTQQSEYLGPQIPSVYPQARGPETARKKTVKQSKLRRLRSGRLPGKLFVRCFDTALQESGDESGEECSNCDVDRLARELLQESIKLAITRRRRRTSKPVVINMMRDRKSDCCEEIGSKKEIVIGCQSLNPVPGLLHELFAPSPAIM